MEEKEKSKKGSRHPSKTMGGITVNPGAYNKNPNTVYVFWNLLGFDIFKNRWHPRMCGGYIKSFVVSKAVDSKAKCPAKLPVMCNDK